MTHSHDHECDCGCDDHCDCNEHSGGEGGVYPPYLTVGTIGFILLAIPMLISGIMNIISFSHDGNVYWDPSIRTVCLYIYAICGICLLIVAAYGFLTGIYAESVLFVIYAVFVLMLFFVVKDTGFTDNATHLVDFTFGVLLLIPMIAFILNKEAILSLATFAYAGGLIISEIITYSNMTTSVMVFGVGAIIAAVLFIYIAIANFLYAEGGYELPLL